MIEVMQILLRTGVAGMLLLKWATIFFVVVARADLAEWHLPATMKY